MKVLGSIILLFYGLKGIIAAMINVNPMGIGGGMYPGGTGFTGLNAGGVFPSIQNNLMPMGGGMLNAGYGYRSNYMSYQPFIVLALDQASKWLGEGIVSPEMVKHITSASQGFLMATQLNPTVFFSMNNIPGLLNYGIQLANDPKNASVWMFVLTSSVLAVGGMSGLVPIMSPIISRFPIRGVGNTIWLAMSKQAGLISGVLKYFNDVFKSVIRQFTQGYNKFCEWLPTSAERESYTEAVIATSQARNNIFVNMLNSGQFADIKGFLRRTTDLPALLGALNESALVPSEPGIYMALKELKRFEGEVSLKDKGPCSNSPKSCQNLGSIIKILQNPLIPATFLEKVLVDYGNKEKLEQVMHGVFSVQSLGFFTDLYTALSQINTEVTAGVLLAMKGAPWSKLNMAITCVFERLINPITTFQCDMDTVRYILNAHPKAIDMIIRRSMITHLMFKKRQHQRQPPPPSYLTPSTELKPAPRDRDNQMNMAKSLCGLFVKSQSIIFSNGLVGVLDLLLESTKKWGDQGVDLSHMEEKSPPIYGRYLGAGILPCGGNNSTNLPEPYGEHQSQNLVLKQVFIKLCAMPAVHPLASEGKDLTELRRRFYLLKNILSGWEKLQPQTKVSIVDLALQLTFNVHPEKMKVLRPIYHMSFKKQFVKRLKGYWRQKNVVMSKEMKELLLG